MMHRLFNRLSAAALLCLALGLSAQAATLAPALRQRLAGVSDQLELGVVIVAFRHEGGLQESHLNLLRGLGITKGLMLNRLGMVAVPVVTAGQVRALAARPEVRSVWSNERLYYYMHQARVVTGVDRLRADPAFTGANGGLPVSGGGDFSVVINDSGIDATHRDLQFGAKVVQNVQVLTGTNTLAGFTPLLALENVPNTDTHVGHGTHCAGILGGTGQASGGKYAGVAPGAKIIGLGSGVGLFILNSLGGFEWTLANQTRYNIRVISNSWGGSGAFDPDDPVNIASRAAHDANIVTLFAAGNSGPGPDTHNPYGKAPWVISVGAGTKEGGLASFSSRGIPADQRLADSDPHNDHDAPTIVAPGTGREFEANASLFTAAVVSTRAITNVVSTGLTDDLEIEPLFIPFYTQISGTSMACPFAAGVVALLLDADPTLTPDEVKQILRETATRMPGREEWEVGAGYINAYAAVDQVFNPSKQFGTFAAATSSNLRTTTTYAPDENFALDYTVSQPGPASANAYRFQVAPGTGVLSVRIDFGTNAVTNEVGNTLGLQLYPPGCADTACGYSSGLTLPVLDSATRQVIVKSPAAGEWVAEVRGLRGLNLAAAGSSTPSLPFGIAVPERVDGQIKRGFISFPAISDIAGRADEAQIIEALTNGRMDIFADGTFRPDAPVLRKDLAEALALNAPLRQTLAAAPKFGDVTGRLAAVAEAVTATGSTLRDYDFTPAGVMSAPTASFSPHLSAVRLDVAVALVRALGLDAEARSKAGLPVTYQGQVLADNAGIPLALRGYVQVAIDRGLLEVYPGTQTGLLSLVSGPRVEPNLALTRAALAQKLNAFAQRFAAGN